MELKIYTKEGVLRLVATSGDNDRATCGIQQESLLYLSFTAFECVALEVYDYAEVAGARYWVVERYRPKMNARREWVYNLQLHGIEALAAQTLMVNPTDGRDDPLLTLTAPAREHAALIVANLNRKMSTSIWKVGQVVVSEYIHIEYTGKYASDALSELAQAAGTEWWFDGTTLNISRCEFGAPVPLAYGDGLTGGIMATVADGVKFFTRLFPVGSSRNIDPDKYGYGRLQLPDRATYVEQDTFLGIVEHYEQEAFAEIYPRRIGRVGTVRHVEKTGEDGEPFDIYYFTDPEIPFNPNDYEIGGLVKQITFQSGELRGRTFEVNYNAKTKEFEIITQWPYDDAMQLPSPPLVPAPGDEYVLWNISLPESYYTAAEKEFREAVDAFMADARKDVSVFNAQTDFTIVDARKLDLRPGQRVRLQNPELFPETGYRDTRIVSVSRSLDNPGSMSLSMSDVLSQGRISRIESDIVRVEQLTRTISTEMPDIIRSWEETPASDATLYSSRKSEREFLNRRRGGDVEAPVRFRQGVSVGGDLRSEEYAAGMTGYGYGFGADGRGEVESMLIRRFLEVPELRYNRTDVAVGDQWRAPGVGLVAEVTVESATGGIVTLKLEEGEAASLRPGDICMGIFHSLDASENATEDYDDSLGNRRFAGFATIYFTVTELLDEGHRFRYTLRPASEKYPRPLHPSPAMTFISYGSFTDPARRASVYATRTYERYLRDVADWEFTAANIAAQFGDLSNLSVHGIAMEGYSAYIDNLYMRGAMRSLDGMFSLDTRSKELLMAVPDSGIGLAFTPRGGLKIGSVYDPATGQFRNPVDFEKMQQDIDDLGYLGKALHNDTQISGGLIQSSVLRMGYVDETSGRWIPRSGTSGIYDASKIGGGIAAWYGGDMLDKADYYTWDDEAFDWVLKPGVTPPEHIAQGLDRMDGTGYRAGGNFWWDADGNLHADPMSFFVGENTVGNVLQLFRYNFRDGASDQSFENVVSVTPRRPFTRLQIGEAMIEWDAAEDGIRIIRADGKPAGLYATKYVSSKGAPGGGGEVGGGASSLGQLVNVDEGADASATYDRVLVRLAGAMHWTTKRLADIAGLDTEALAEYLTTNKYATQQWVQSQGYLKSEAMADYATQTWVNRNFIQAIGTDGIYLSLVKGDGTKTRLIPPCAYGTRDTVLRRGSANVNFSNDGQLRHFLSSGSMTEGRPMGDGHIIHMEWDNSLSWAGQLFLPNASSASMQWRTQPGSTWGAWRTLLDEANYAATLDGRYMSFVVEAGRDYVNASLSAAVGKKAHEGFIEFWDSAAGGWFNFKLGWLEAAGQVKAASFIRNGGTASQFLKADGSVDGTAYVNKAGDTLTGTLTAKRDQFLASGAAGIDMNNSDVTRLNGLWFADEYNSAGEAINFYVDGSLWSRLGASGGQLYFNPSVGISAHAFGHKVWHAGNDGDGSGLDADKLDGLHSTAFARCDKFQQVDLNTLNDFGFMENRTSADATPERHYPIQEAGLLIYGRAAYSSANQIYGSYYSNRWFARGGGWSTTSKTAWREFAFLDSNVASASKLATARTLWGQSFDGSGNVSGDMTGVGKITTTTLAIATTYDNTWSDGTNSHPWYGYDHRYHNTGVYSTTISDFYGLTLRTSQGYISMNATGNVGIGTTSPTQKLHVADGNVLVSGEAYYRTEGRAGSSWNNGFGALSVGIMNNNSQTPLLVAYRYGDLNWTTPHANRLFAMELLNSGSVLRFGFGGAAKFYFEKDGTFHTEKGLWAAQYVSSKGASASSDIRLKYNFESLTLTLEQIAAAPAVRYRWRDTGEVDLGSTSQYWLRILSEGVRIQPNGFYGMAYDKIALVSAIFLARHALGVKNRVDDHETRIQKIEQRINR